MTIEGIDEDDGCTGDCCTEPERRPTCGPGLFARIRAALGRGGRMFKAG